MKLSEIKLNTPYWIANAIMYVVSAGSNVVDHVLAVDHGADPYDPFGYAMRLHWYPVDAVEREASKEEVAAQRRTQVPPSDARVSCEDQGKINNCWCVKVMKEEPCSSPRSS